MAGIVAENVSRNLWPSKLKLLEAEYENTKLLVNQETLKCERWKQEIDLLVKEEKLHRKSLNVRKLCRTVKQKDDEIVVTKQTSKDEMKILENHLRNESETKLTVQQEKHKKEKDKLEKEIKFLKDMKSNLEAEMKEMEKSLISETDQKMKKQEEKHVKVKEQLEKEIETLKENHTKAEQEIEQLKQENAKNILAKEKIEEEIKVIRRTLKTETDEKLIQQVEKSTQEKCQLTHEIQEWKEKHEKALQEIENFKKELSAKNVVTKARSTQTTATKTHSKGITVNTGCCEKETQVDELLPQDLPEENLNPNTEENGNHESSGDQKTAEMHLDKTSKKQNNVISKKGKTSEKQRSVEEQNHDVPTDDLVFEHKTKAVEKTNEKSKTQKRRKKRDEKVEKEKTDEDLQISEKESTNSHEQKDDEKIEKATSSKEKKQQQRKKENKNKKLPYEVDDEDVVMEEQECDSTVAETENEKINDELEDVAVKDNRQERARKENGETQNKTDTKTDETNDENKNSTVPVASNTEGNPTKTVRKRKEPPLVEASCNVSASKAKKLRSTASESERDDDVFEGDENSQIPDSNAADDAASDSEALTKTASTGSANSKESMNGLEQEKENAEKIGDGMPKNKHVHQNKSIPSKNPIQRPSTSIRQTNTYDISTILNRTKSKVPSTSTQQPTAFDKSTVLHKTKPSLYRPSTNVRQSTASDMSVLNGTKPSVYRPSMSIRQSSVSDMSSVLNGTKRRTLYNSKADNSLMVSMLPLQESFMNSTTSSRGKKANGTMPASLSAFLKSFTAPKLKKQNST